METVEPEGTGAVYEILGPGGPHQSIHEGKTERVVDLIDRSSTMPGSVYRRPGLEGAKPKSNGAMEIMNKEFQLQKEKHYSSYYKIWKLSKQAWSGPWTWVKEELILDPEVME